MFDIDVNRPYHIGYHTLDDKHEEKCVNANYLEFKELYEKDDREEIKITYVAVANPLMASDYTDLYNQPEED